MLWRVVKLPTGVFLTVTTAFMPSSHQVRKRTIPNNLVRSIQRTSSQSNHCLMSTFGGMRQPDPNWDEDQADNEDAFEVQASLDLTFPSAPKSDSKVDCSDTSNAKNTNSDEDGTANRIRYLLSIISGETSPSHLQHGCELTFGSVLQNRDRMALKLPIDDHHDWEKLIQAGLTWDQLLTYCKFDALPLDYLQIGPLCLSNISLNKDSFHQVLQLGSTWKESMCISIIRDEKETAAEKYSTHQHVLFLKGLLKLYTSMRADHRLGCNLSQSVFTPATMWAYSFDWGIIMDKVVHTSDSVAFGTSQNVDRWLVRHCRKMLLFGCHVPINTYLHNFLVNADSHIETLDGLELRGCEVEQFSVILQQSSKVKALGITLSKYAPTDVTASVLAICRCSHLKRVNIYSGGFNRVTPEQLVNNLMSLIQSGHLQSIHYECRLDESELGIMAADEAESQKLERTRMITDAIEANTNVLHMQFCCDVNARSFIDIDKIESMMKTRKNGSG